MKLLNPFSFFFNFFYSLLLNQLYSNRANSYEHRDTHTHPYAICKHKLGFIEIQTLTHGLENSIACEHARAPTRKRVEI